MVDWQPMNTAPKDKTVVLLKLRDDLPDHAKHFNGIRFVGRHVGLGDDGFDVGWNFAAPVGMGGFRDEWMVGWQPVPD